MGLAASSTSTSSVPVESRARRGFLETFSLAAPKLASAAETEGVTRSPDLTITSPARASTPREGDELSGLHGRFDLDQAVAQYADDFDLPRRRPRPRGTGAPVIIRTASPALRLPSKARPAAASPIARSLTARSGVAVFGLGRPQRVTVHARPVEWRQVEIGDAIAAQDTPDGSRQSYLFLIQSRRVSENDVERVFDAEHKC